MGIVCSVCQITRYPDNLLGPCLLLFWPRDIIQRVHCPRLRVGESIFWRQKAYETPSLPLKFLWQECELGARPHAQFCTIRENREACQHETPVLECHTELYPILWGHHMCQFRPNSFRKYPTKLTRAMTVPKFVSSSWQIRNGLDVYSFDWCPDV